MIIQVCVGSSCHLKGSGEIVELLQKAVEQYHLEDEVTLSGSFCIGKCNRIGVTIQVDDDIIVGVTKENFKEFFKENVLNKFERK
ncbi:MAG: NAD(P)H-dependent oxidoreductase subunit E [Acutalibacteraceae bacterium]|nr:NAD(P)H-dependent oxidoreductase subunit E [Acutalibacteraceae bacterium]